MTARSLNPPGESVRGVLSKGSGCSRPSILREPPGPDPPHLVTCLARAAYYAASNISILIPRPPMSQLPTPISNSVRVDVASHGSIFLGVLVPSWQSGASRALPVEAFEFENIPMGLVLGGICPVLLEIAAWREGSREISPAKWVSRAGI